MGNLLTLADVDVEGFRLAAVCESQLSPPGCFVFTVSTTLCLAAVGVGRCPVKAPSVFRHGVMFHNVSPLCLFNAPVQPSRGGPHKCPREANQRRASLIPP